MKGDILIGIFKLAKSATLLALALTGISLLDFKIRGPLLHRITQLTGDAHFRALTRVANLIGFEPDKKILLFSLGAFFYSALFAVEGIGLLLQKRWAEFFTAIITASFIPIEVYELIRRYELFKIGVLIINIMVLVYLIWKINNK